MEIVRAKEENSDETNALSLDPLLPPRKRSNKLSSKLKKEFNTDKLTLKAFSPCVFSSPKVLVSTFSQRNPFTPLDSNSEGSEFENEAAECCSEIM